MPLHRFKDEFSVLRGLVEIIALPELIGTSASINKLLLAGKERMALGTNVDPDVFLGGTCLDDVTASAPDLGFFICGMDTVFHVVSLLSVAIAL